MNKELIDRAWACLPREFKEEVKKKYARCVEIDADDNSNLPAYAVKSAIQRRALLEKLFGVHNLTSDAEGEEMLTVKASTVCEMFAANERLKRDFPGSITATTSDQINHVIQHLFASRCLPDDQSAKTAHWSSSDAENSEKPNLSKEPKFKVGDKVRVVKIGSTLHHAIGEVIDIDNSEGCFVLFPRSQMWLKFIDLEPYSEPEGTHQDRHVPESGKSGTNTETITGNSETPNFPEGFDGVHPVANKKVVDDILRHILARERRLDIAAKALQAILSNPDRMNRYEKIAQQSSGTLTGLVASNALRYADALIAAWSTT